jgi:uncharacterized membrane protein
MSSPASIAAPAAKRVRLPKALALAVILLVAIAFVLKYVFHYYLNYNPAGFGPHWMDRGTLLVHITGGMVALLIGPWQFSQRLRQRHLQLHRLLGRVYLIAVLCGSLAAFRLAVTTTFGAMWGFSLFSMALAWITCASMAFYAVKQRQIQVHQEWMVRTYVVTFGFVTFRLLNDIGPTSRIGSDAERGDVYIWACWVLPLLAAEVIMQLRRMRH